MSLLVKQSTAVTVVLGPFVDQVDGFTAKTALTITQSEVRLSKNAGAFAQKGDATSLTHMENGYYTCPLNTTDTGTLGHLRVAVNKAGALPVWQDFLVVPAAVYDAWVSGTGNGVRADVQVLAAGSITTSTFAAGAINAAAIGADAITAAKVADGTIDALTFAAGAINAAALAADAITAAKIAADAGTEIAAAVWDKARSAHVTAGSFGEGVASVQGNVTGSVASVTGAVGSVTGAVGSVGAGGITAASLAADAITAAKVAADVGQEIADEVLNRNLAGGGSGNTRNVRNALRILRNKRTLAAGTLTVTEEDDTTSAWTAAVTQTAGNPVTAIDPA